MAEQQQKNVTFRGNVQGVGFRYTTCRIAGGYDVTGYVKNEPDGTVTVVAEGDPGQVEAFLGDIEQRMGRHIRDKSEQSAPASGRFGSFGVKY